MSTTEDRFDVSATEATKRAEWKSRGKLKRIVTGIPLPTLTHQERQALIAMPFPAIRYVPGKTWAGVLIEDMETRLDRLKRPPSRLKLAGIGTVESLVDMMDRLS